MKRILWCVCFLLVFGRPAIAQVIAPNQTITVIDSGTACVTAPAACAIWPPGTANSITIDISGTWTGTLTFEASANGGAFNSVLMTNLATGGQATSTTANGTFSVSNTGIVSLRVRATAAMTGTAVLSATRGYLNARNLAPIFPLSGSAVGDLLTVSATSPLTFASLADTATGRVLTSGGVGVAPLWSPTPTASSYLFPLSTTLTEDAADTLAQRRSTNPQTFRVYNTFTDASNYERGEMAWLTNRLAIGAANAGTGASRSVDFYGSDFSFKPGAFGSAGSAMGFGTNGITVYRAIATAGWGVPAIYAAGRATAQTGANASVSTYTPSSGDGSFEVSANVLVTTATTHSFTVTCAYTDEGNTARTVTMTFRLVASPTTITTTIVNTNGAVPYQGEVLHIRVKSGTAITIATTGTFTTVAYNVEGIIRQIR